MPTLNPDVGGSDDFAFSYTGTSQANSGANRGAPRAVSNEAPSVPQPTSPTRAPSPTSPTNAPRSSANDDPFESWVAHRMQAERRAAEEALNEQVNSAASRLSADHIREVRRYWRMVSPSGAPPNMPMSMSSKVDFRNAKEEIVQIAKGDVGSLWDEVKMPSRMVNVGKVPLQSVPPHYNE